MVLFLFPSLCCRFLIVTLFLLPSIEALERARARPKSSRIILYYQCLCERDAAKALLSPFPISNTTYSLVLYWQFSNLLLMTWAKIFLNMNFFLFAFLLRCRHLLLVFEWSVCGIDRLLEYSYIWSTSRPFFSFYHH